MKPKEFNKIMTDFVEEDKRWRALKVGDTIYEPISVGFDTDYHKAIIVEIDREDREIIGQSINGEDKGKVLDFITKEEYDKMFNPLIKD
jgi:hypothetical protein